MPKPQCRQDLQRLLGMINYLRQFIPNMSEITTPLRSLLQQNTHWSWNHEHDKSLDVIKRILSTQPLLAFFDSQKDVTIQVDASSHGLGACLLQNDHPVCYASRSLTISETRYAQIEKELLAVVFACERFNQYTYGRKVSIKNDHKPLKHIMAKPLSEALPRIQRLYTHPTAKVPGRRRLHSW